VPATAVAAGTPGGEIGGGEHEQPAERVEVAGLAGMDGGVVGTEGGVIAGSVGREAVGTGPVQAVRSLGVRHADRR
jgi:hypothetical protein